MQFDTSRSAKSADRDRSRSTQPAETKERETEESNRSNRQHTRIDTPHTGTHSVEELEAYYGIEINDRDTLQQLSVLEKKYAPERLRELFADGVPMEAMRSEETIQQYRDQQGSDPNRESTGSESPR